MPETDSDDLIQLTRDLLTSIEQGDWEQYQQLCDSSLTCFEPETRGQLVEGMDFHRFYFDLGGHLGKHVSTICSPHVRMLGPDAAVVSLVRLIQHTDADGTPHTRRFEETRVWQRAEGGWRHVHFHRSASE